AGIASALFQPRAHLLGLDLLAAIVLPALHLGDGGYERLQQAPRTGLVRAAVRSTIARQRARRGGQAEPGDPDLRARRRLRIGCAFERGPRNRPIVVPAQLDQRQVLTRDLRYGIPVAHHDLFDFVDVLIAHLVQIIDTDDDLGFALLLCAEARDAMCRR